MRKTFKLEALPTPASFKYILEFVSVKLMTAFMCNYKEGAHMDSSQSEHFFFFFFGDSSKLLCVLL